MIMVVLQSRRRGVWRRVLAEIYGVFFVIRIRYKLRASTTSYDSLIAVVRTLPRVAYFLPLKVPVKRSGKIAKEVSTKSRRKPLFAWF